MGTVFEKLCFQKYPNTSGQATLLFSGEIDASWEKKLNRHILTENAGFKRLFSASRHKSDVGRRKTDHGNELGQTFQ